MNTPGTLIISHITKGYVPEAPPVLAELSLNVGVGEAVAIIGPSGSGKSTLLHLIGSLDVPTSGTICLDATEVTALTGNALTSYRATEVGFIFQDHHLLPQLTALENVLLPTLAAGGEDNTARARELLHRVGVAHRAHAYPAQMSGGERQRVAVARALINEPRLLLCDEPTGNLDQETGAGIIALLLEVATQGVMVLMVTHNLMHAARFDRCLELRDGRLYPCEHLSRGELA